MAEESFSDMMFSRIKKNTIINGIRELFRRFPQAKMILPFAKESIVNIKTEVDSYLGDFDKVIVIARKNGQARIMVIEGKHPFVLSDKEWWSSKPFILNKTLAEYEKDLNDTGIFNEMTEDVQKKYTEFRNKVNEDSFDDISNIDFGKIKDAFQETTEDNPDMRVLPNTNNE